MFACLSVCLFRNGVGDFLNKIILTIFTSPRLWAMATVSIFTQQKTAQNICNIRNQFSKQLVLVQTNTWCTLANVRISGQRNFKTNWPISLNPTVLLRDTSWTSPHTILILSRNSSAEVYTRLCATLCAYKQATKRPLSMDTEFVESTEGNSQNRISKLTEFFHRQMAWRPV